MTPARIQRHFVTLDDKWGPRQVHYRRAGSGPPVLLLHQSPRSSREFEPLIEAWAQHFTVIAPDTPGFGLSDPLPVNRVTMEELAAGVAAFGDALGLERFSVYGLHTGGSMAIALADAFPERVCAVVANGLIMPTPEERTSLVQNYLPAFVPAWDGSHLAWLWARLREQTVFFPWYEHSLANRMDYDMPPPGALQSGVTDFLQAGDRYRVGYRAAFEYGAAPALSRLQPPTLVTAARLDPLAPHLERIAGQSANVEVGVSADAMEARERACRLLLEHARGTAPSAPPARPAGNALWQDTRNPDPAPVRLRRCGTGSGALVLHAAGGSAMTVDDLTRALGDAIAVDLPGHGEHAPPAGDGLTVDDCVNAAMKLLDHLGSSPLLLAGEGEGAWVAAELARRAPERCRALLLKDPPLLSEDDRAAFLEHGLPSLAADWHGGHLSRAWHLVRDGRLFHPWFARNRRAIRWTEPDLDTERLMLEVRERLTADGWWQALVRDALEFPATQALGEIGLPRWLVVSADNPEADRVEALARGIAGCRFLRLPPDPGRWKEVLGGLG